MYRLGEGPLVYRFGEACFGEGRLGAASVGTTFMRITLVRTIWELL